MRTLSIEAASVDCAYGLCGALERFGAALEDAAERPVVRVELSGGSEEIVALLHAIQEYVTMRPSGPTLIGLDGRRYLLDATA
jgi:hypothetical protein